MLPPGGSSMFWILPPGRRSWCRLSENHSHPSLMRPYLGRATLVYLRMQAIDFWRIVANCENPQEATSEAKSAMEVFTLCRFLPLAAHLDFDCRMICLVIRPIGRTLLRSRVLRERSGTLRLAFVWRPQLLGGLHRLLIATFGTMTNPSSRDDDNELNFHLLVI
jgi:hypothetical protein